MKIIKLDSEHKTDKIGKTTKSVRDEDMIQPYSNTVKIYSYQIFFHETVRANEYDSKSIVGHDAYSSELFNKTLLNYLGVPYVASTAPGDGLKSYTTHFNDITIISKTSVDREREGKPACYGSLITIGKEKDLEKLEVTLDKLFPGITNGVSKADFKVKKF